MGQSFPSVWSAVSKIYIHVYALFLPQGIKIKFLFTLQAAVQNYYIGHKTQPLPEVPEVAHVYSVSTPDGSKLSLVSLIYALAAISEIQADFQSYHIDGNEAWSLGKVADVEHVLFLSTPEGLN